MKSELRIAAHAVIDGAVVVEVWFGGVFLATVTGADGPGVRVITKHGIVVDHLDPRDHGVGAVTVWIDPSR